MRVYLVSVKVAERHSVQALSSRGEGGVRGMAMPWVAFIDRGAARGMAVRCIVFYRTEGNADLQQRINARLLNDPGAPPCLVFTELTRLECRTKPLAAEDTLLLAGYDDSFATPGYLRQPMNTAVFDLATDLRARHRLKTPDALHLAAAITAGCGEFWTNDGRLCAAAAPYLRRLTLDSL